MRIWIHVPFPVKSLTQPAVAVKRAVSIQGAASLSVLKGKAKIIPAMRKFPGCQNRDDTRIFPRPGH
jgi:hypothetical protein